MADPVLIVGAGPTGLTAALELSRLGIPVRLIDKLKQPRTTSRALVVQARTLELLQQRGLAEEMVRLGNPGHGGAIYGGGKILFRIDFSRIDSRYNSILFLSQAETERILREALAGYGVQTERGVEVVAVAQDALSHAESPASAVLRHEDGRLEHVHTPWLISAEGAHSLVRTTLDLHYEGKTIADEYALGDLLIEGGLAETEFHIFSSEHGFLALFPMRNGRFRLIASDPLSHPAPDTSPSLDELQRIYDQRSPIPARLHDMNWSSWFRINSRMVSRLVVGRLLLGGDAAHIHSPAGGQGMNTGIQDMINLCWKLALVIKGHAKPELLRSYEQDRLPVMREVLTRTEGLTEVIGVESHLARLLFNHLSPFVGGSALVQNAATSRMSQIAIDYRHSPLSAQHFPCGALHAGDRLPDIPVRTRNGNGWEEASLVDLLDPSRFTALAIHRSEAGILPDQTRQAVDGFGQLAVLRELAAPSEPAAHAAFRAKLGASDSVILVRPDSYAAMTSSAAGAARHLDQFRAAWLKPNGPVPAAS